MSLNKDPWWGRPWSTWSCRYISTFHPYILKIRMIPITLLVSGLMKNRVDTNTFAFYFKQTSYIKKISLGMTVQVVPTKMSWEVNQASNRHIRSITAVIHLGMYDGSSMFSSKKSKNIPCLKAWCGWDFNYDSFFLRGAVLFW